MPCYYPIQAFQQPHGGRVELYARDQHDLFRNRLGKHFTVPCGKCSGCRRTQALNFATRCMHEAKQHRYNSYITLTYDDKHLPQDLSLQHEHFVTFMKALRNALDRMKIIPSDTVQAEKLDGKTEHIISDDTWKLTCTYEDRPHPLIPELTTPRPIPPRFYMGGEYGTLYGRPHYHAILFGVAFTDRTYHGRTKAGAKLYKSDTLARLWTRGYSSIGDVTFASAAYIARYVMKKRTGDGNKDTYEIIDPETGEIYFRKKEYNQMSRNPGLGKTWFDKYHQDYIHQDKIRLIDGKEVKPPRYYDKQLKRLDREIYEHTKHAREIEQLANAHNNTPERLAVRELVDNAKARLQTRNLE